MVYDIDDISIEYKRGTVEYWRSVWQIKAKDNWICKIKFGKVISAGQLRRWQMNVGGSRLETLGRISVYTLDKFIDAIHRGAMIYDIDITRWAL